MLGLYEAVQKAPLAQPQDAPASPQLRDLLDQLLAKDPTARPGLEQIAAHAWVSKGSAAPLAIPLVTPFNSKSTCFGAFCCRQQARAVMWELAQARQGAAQVAARN